MKILLTNDDGVHAPGIQLFAEGLRKAGHRVYVFAPEKNQSGVSQAITFVHGPLKIAETAPDAWSCGGTPSDCVIVALAGGIPEPPDVVIAGINQGCNLGTDIIYSGTTAAARQGAFKGLPSLAFSLAAGEEGAAHSSWNWDMAVSFSVEHLDEALGYWKPDTFININIPNRREKPSKLVHAFPSFRYYNDRIEIYSAPDEHRYSFVKPVRGEAKPEQGSDWEIVTGGNASLSDIYIHPLLKESARERGGV